MPSVESLSDQELELLRRAVQKEQAARRRADTSPERIEAQIGEYQKAQGREDGDQWEQPVSVLDAYLMDAVVTDEGELWRSLISGNSHKPGVAGWRLEPGTDEDGNPVYPRFVRPSMAEDAYRKGVRITWEDDLVYEAVRDGVVHDPAEYPADWKLITNPDDEDEDDHGDGGDGEPVPEFPQWVPEGHQYSTGDKLTYQALRYTVLMDHTSQPHWTPDAVPALYELVGTVP